MDIYTKNAINNKLTKKQDKLVSGTNIKTINGNSLLGSGNMEISGGGECSQFTRLELKSSKVSMRLPELYSLIRIYGASLDFKLKTTLQLKNGTTVVYSFSASDFINGVCNIQRTNYVYINGVEKSFSLYGGGTLEGNFTEGAMIYVEVLSGHDY